MASPNILGVSTKLVWLTPKHVRSRRYQAQSEITFSFATLVTREDEYDAMVESALAKGFSTDSCEFLFLNNTVGNALSAFKGLNRLMQEARGEYIILCHQDIRFTDDDADALRLRLAALSALDPNWAVAGNAGGVAPGQLAIRITDPHGKGTCKGNYPVRVQSVDENFIRRAA